MGIKARTRSKQKPDMEPGLLAFCENYLATWNAAESYQRVHPNAKRNSCWTAGERLLRKDEVQKYIAKRLKTMTMTADEVLTRLTEHARADLSPFLAVNDEGFASFDFSTPEAKAKMHLIKKMKTVRTRRVQGRGKTAKPWEDERIDVEIHDPQKALEDLAKYHRLFRDTADEEDERFLKLAAIIEGVKQRVSDKHLTNNSQTDDNRPSNPGS